MELINRVFYHELGHFVARELNLRYYNGSGVAAINIYPCDPSSEIFCGKLTPVLPPNATINQQVPRVRLAEYLAAVMYGCIFQAYYLQESTFRSCLNDYGQKDFNSWMGALFNNKLWNNDAQFRECENVHYRYLVENNVLTSFMKFDPASYLVETTKNTFSVDLELLRKDTHSIIEDLLPHYSMLINEYELLINSSSHEHDEL